MILSKFSFLIILLLHAAQTGQAQSPPTPDPYRQNFNPSIGVVIIVLIAALLFMGFFSIYIRHCSQDTSTSGGGSRRAIIGSVARSRRAPRGLERDIIDSFPIFGYDKVKELKIGKGALECAVCLTEFEDDDTLRLLPKCDHVFHPDCIDAWLVGHTTCPVCRSDLVSHNPELGCATHAPDVIETSEVTREEEVEEEEDQERPLHGRVMSRSRTMMRNISFGRPRWMGKMNFGRSFSTGHVAVKQWENMERFTLRLPDEVRKQLVNNGKLQRTTSLVVLPRETSSRRGYRTGFGEGSSRINGRFGNRSDRWVFSLAPPFFSRASSIKSPKVAVTESRSGSLRGSVRSESNRLPV